MGAVPAVRRVLTRRLATPLGEMVAGATGAGICMLEFAERAEGRADPVAGRADWAEGRADPAAPGPNPHLDALDRQLGEYFRGARQGFDVPLVLAGTAFQERVWRALLDIPYGATVGYGELARRVGSGGGARAVGRANGDNRIAIVVPCHRVVRADGDPGGYGGGLSRKRWLLELESGGTQGSLW